MRKTLFVLVLVVALMAMAVPVQATQNVAVSGDWTYVPTIVDVREEGQNLIIYGRDVGTWTGSFEGTSVERFTVVVHPQYNVYEGVILFEGYVDGKYGTMMLHTHGKQYPGGLEPGTGGDWVGQWMIMSATDELEGMRGHGTFWGPSLDVDYAGHCFF